MQVLKYRYSCYRNTGFRYWIQYRNTGIRFRYWKLYFGPLKSLKTISSKITKYWFHGKCFRILVESTQCGNFKILCHVKSISDLLKFKKCNFLLFQIFLFCSFCFSGSKKLISRKIWVTEKFEISTLWCKYEPVKICKLNEWKIQNKTFLCYLKCLTKVPRWMVAWITGIVCEQDLTI